MTTQLLTVNTDHALLEVDHLQIYTGIGLPSVSAFQGLGLNDANQIVRREAQGIASTLFFFRNAYLELIWIEDENTFQQYAAQTKMNLLTRSQWRQTGASPFAVGLRSKAYYQSSTWGYSENTINFSADNLEAIREPLCFMVPPQIALTNWLDDANEIHQQFLTHPLGVRRLTGIKIKMTTHKSLTNAVSLLEDNGIIAIERGMTPLLELTFDGNARNQLVDARPILPLQLRY